MKKIIIIFMIISSGFAFAQEDTGNTFVYESQVEEEEPENFPGNPGDPAPIDQYIPVLLIIAASLVVVYANKKKSHKIKN